VTHVLLALAVLAFGATASGLTARIFGGGLWIGLTAAGIAGALCVIGGWDALGSTTTIRISAEWPLPLGFARLAVDGLSAWFLLVIGMVSIGASIYSWGYFRNAKTHGPVGAYAPLVCTMIAAMVLVVCAADVVVFLVGWELMSLSAFFLVGFHDEDTEARRGAWTYLIATHLGTALGVLPVFAAFVARTASTAMDGFTGAFGASEVTSCVVIFALGVVGFGTKAGFMPFHVWLPAAHPVAPSPVSALMSGVVIKMGIYGLLRLLSWLPDLPIGCAIGLMTVSLLTGVMGILYALGQQQIKRMLAYSSVENIGIIGLAISVALLGRSLQQPVLVAFGLGGALLHVLNHALFKGLLFLSAGAVLHDTGTGDMERLGGLARRTPVNALAFLIGSVAICALPPLNGFVSEFAIYTGILQGVVHLPSSYAAVFASCAAVLALIGGLALVVFSKTFSVVFLGAQRDRSVSVHTTPASMNAGMVFLALGCVAVASASGAMVPAVSAALTPFGAAASGQAKTFVESLGLVTRFLPPLGVLIVVAIGLLAFRRRMPLGGAVGGMGGTWGCGYALPATTMQYTGSSYAWKVIHSFRHVIRPKRKTPSIVGCFPSQDRLVTVMADMAQERIYKPVFTGLARMFERLWPLQHGRIQLYLIYIVATVLIVFLVEGWSAPFAAHKNDGATRSAGESQLRDVQVESVVTGGSSHD
jgi:hydrogenase-4 component B